MKLIVLILHVNKMASSAKYLPKSEPPTDATPRRLAARVSRLRQPANLRMVELVETVALPQRILMFHRKKALPPLATSHHHRFVCVFPIRTPGHIIVEQQVFILTPGRGMVIHPWQYHHFAEFGSPNILWLFITFESQEPQSLAGLRNTPFALSDADIDQLHRCLALYPKVREPTAGGAPSISAANELSLRLGLLLQHWNDQTPPAAESVVTLSDADRQMVDRVARYVLNHISDPTSVEEIAEALGVSTRHLRQKFRQCCGLSPSHYIRQVKLHRATHLLSTTRQSISDIARTCGFSSIYSFSRVFRNSLGVAPREYRRQLAPPSGSARTPEEQSI